MVDRAPSPGTNPTLTSNGNNERVSDVRLAELVSHYRNVDEQHNGWWIAIYWCLRELQDWRKGCTGKHGSQAACVDSPPSEMVTELEALRAENANLRANYMRLMGGAAPETLPSPLPDGKPVRTYPDYPVAGIYEAGLGVWNGGTKDEGDI